MYVSFNGNPSLTYLQLIEIIVAPIRSEPAATTLHFLGVPKKHQDMLRDEVAEAGRGRLLRELLEESLFLN